MLNKFIVSMGERSYPIYFNTDFSHLGEILEISKVVGKMLLITDSVVERYYGHEVIGILEATGLEVHSFVIPSGEASKNVSIVNGIYSYLLEKKFDRGAAIVALGGGVVGDISGFVAATYLRGVKFIQIPTTLLSQVDSSIGGKVGVDFNGYKNVIGAFYQPKSVYINVNPLKTLPEREIRSGLAEVVKHGIIKSEELFDYIEYNKNKIFSLDENTLQYIIKESCLIKRNIVEMDEHEETDLRALLNFGHTIGHAVESAKNFELLHGECVQIGMFGAFKLAYYMDMLDKGVLEKISKVFDKLGFMKSYTGVSPEKVFEKIACDKKVKKGKIFFVLPKQIGEVYYLAIDNEDLIKRVINELRHENET